MHDIIFITNTDRHDVSFSTRNSTVGRMLVRTLMHDNDVFSLDFETTGLDPLVDKLLLTSIHVGGVTFVIDNTTVALTDILTSEDVEDKLCISHHAKFEYKFCILNGLKLGKIFCTMVAEQRLIMGTGFSASIVETLKRRGIEIPEGMNKEVRNSFIGANPETVVWTNEEILYSGGDVVILEPLKAKQDIFIERFNMEHLIYEIEMPLIAILGDSELEGFAHNSEQWIAYAKTKQEEAEVIIAELNRFIIFDKGVDVESINPELIKKKLGKENKTARLEARKLKLEEKIADFEAKEKTHLKAYQVTMETYQKVCDELVDAELNEIDTIEEYGINWGSSDQVIKVFEALGVPIPMDKNKITKKMQPSVGKDARSTWFNAHGTGEWNEFFTKFDKYKKLIHNVNSFGEQWVKNYTHPVTDKVHTYFWQCSTETGRLASGDAKNGLFNGQQIPAIKELRECFIADEGCDLITIDLSSAELVVMSSLADDKHLYNLFVVYDDIHSSILTKAWRKIYAHRGEMQLAEDYIVSKTVNADKRKKGKNGTFAVVYGAYPAKLATTLDITVPEANLYVEAVEEEIEPTIKFVSSKSQEALSKGYVIHNTRTNSRRWFTPVLEVMKQGGELTFKETSNVSSTARNTCIQGTQADMVKEAMVKIDRFNKINNLKSIVKLKLQVHDELVYQKPIGLTVTCPYTQEIVKYEDYVHKELTTTANLYLREGYNMGAEYHVASYWLK